MRSAKLDFMLTEAHTQIIVLSDVIAKAVKARQVLAWAVGIAVIGLAFMLVWYERDIITASETIARKNAEIAISERDLAHSLAVGIVRSAPWAMIVCDEDGVVQLWNPAAEKLFGWTKAEMVGTLADQTIPERFRDRHHAAMKKAIGKFSTSGVEYSPTIKHHKIVCLHRSGHEFLAEGWFREFKLHSGRIKVVVAIKAEGDEE